MAVIKTCCGCLSTKGGTFAVLLLHFAAYVASIIELSILVQDDSTTLADLWNSTVLTTQVYSQCDSAKYNETWRCSTLQSVSSSSKWIAVGLIIVAAVWTIACLIALVGTVKDLHLFLLPWIIGDLISFVGKLCGLVLALILWAISIQATAADTSFLIAAIVAAAGILALCFYMWLCVVSHFQSLKELRDLGFLDNNKDTNGELDKGKDSVHPFVVHDDDVTTTGGGGSEYDASTEEIKSVDSKGDDDDDSSSDEDSNGPDVESPNDDDKNSGGKGKTTPENNE